MKVQAERLKEIAVHILKGLHAADGEAAVVADALIQAELRGIDTHGVHLLTLLPERVEAGMLQHSDEADRAARRAAQRRSSTAETAWVRRPPIGRWG